MAFKTTESLGVEPLRTELIKSELAVEIHDDHFARDEDGGVWLKSVGTRVHEGSQTPPCNLENAEPVTKALQQLEITYGGFPRTPKGWV